MVKKYRIHYRVENPYDEGFSFTQTTTMHLDHHANVARLLHIQLDLMQSEQIVIVKKEEIK